MPKSLFELALTALSITLLLLSPGCPGQELAEVDRVAEKLHEKKIARVVAIDFSSQNGKLSALGQKLSDQLSAALTRRMTTNRVVERTQLSARLRANGLSPSDLRDRDIASWLGSETGAKGIIVGYLVAREGEYVLSRVAWSPGFQEAS